MAYPNPLSDVPKVNGDRIHVRNQSDSDIDGTLVLLSQPVKGPSRKRKAGWLLSVIGWAIVALSVLLLWSVTIKAAQQVVRKPVVRQKNESFEERMERRNREAMEAQP